jgi:hypothetical protein
MACLHNRATDPRLTRREDAVWYLASVLFAQPSSPTGHPILCETSQFLVEADNAATAYEKAIAWGERRRAQVQGFDFVGVQQLKRLQGDGPPRDGDEIDGRVYESDDLWSRTSELIPPKEKLAALFLEENPGAQLSDVLSQDERSLVLRILEET